MDIKDYAGKYSEHYSGDFKLEPVLVKYRREKVIDSYDKFKHNNILEIGCGMEPFFKFVNDFVKFVIVEPAEEFVKNAEYLSSGDERIKVFQGFFEDKVEDIKNTDFDFIIFSSLIHEVNDPNKLLSQIRSLCNKDTVVHINVPNMFSFHRLLAAETGLIKDIFERSSLDKKFQRTGNFDLKQLSEIAEQNGFQIIDKGSYFIKPFTNEQIEKIITSGIADEIIFEGLNKMIKYLPEMGAEIFVNLRIS